MLRMQNLAAADNAEGETDGEPLTTIEELEDGTTLSPIIAKASSHRDTSPRSPAASGAAHGSDLGACCCIVSTITRLACVMQR